MDGWMDGWIKIKHLYRRKALHYSNKMMMMIMLMMMMIMVMKKMIMFMMMIMMMIMTIMTILMMKVMMMIMTMLIIMMMKMMMIMTMLIIMMMMKMMIMTMINIPVDVFLLDLPGVRVGQNLGFGYHNFSSSVEAWYDEVDVFEYGTGALTSDPIGHYTQVLIFFF